MNGLRFWWFSSSKSERLTILVVAIAGSAAIVVVSVVKAVPSLSCLAANEARTAADAAMKEADHAGPEDRCDAYRKMSALLARYQTDWWSCVPLDGKDRTAALDVQARFYEKLVRTCD